MISRGENNKPMSGGRSRRPPLPHLMDPRPVSACPGRRSLAREVLERYRYFRPDMDCAFDTSFGLRLAFAGELPVLPDSEVAVRVVHRAIAEPPA